jgi:type III secretion protein L
MEDSGKVIKVIKGKEKAVSPVKEDIAGLDSIEQDGIIRGEVYSASSKARELLRKAQQEADEILRDAQEQREKDKQQGYQEGYQEGLAQVTELLVKARLEHEQLLRNANKDLMDLAFKIAEKIIGTQLQIDQSTILSIVAQAMQGVRQSRQLTIRVHPADAKILREQKDELLEKLGGQRVVDILEDKKVLQGGCIIESEIGTVEAQLQTQLERLRKALTMQTKPVR